MQSQYNPTDKDEKPMEKENNDSTKQVGNLLAEQKSAPKPAASASASAASVQYNSTYPNRFKNWAFVPGNEGDYSRIGRQVSTVSHYEDHEDFSYTCSNRRSGPRG
jgi:hypothetical protein